MEEYPDLDLEVQIGSVRDRRSVLRTSRQNLSLFGLAMYLGVTGPSSPIQEMD